MDSFWHVLWTKPLIFLCERIAERRASEIVETVKKWTIFRRVSWITILISYATVPRSGAQAKFFNTREKVGSFSACSLDQTPFFMRARHGAGRERIFFDP